MRRQLIRWASKLGKLILRPSGRLTDLNFNLISLCLFLNRSKEVTTDLLYKSYYLEIALKQTLKSLIANIIFDRRYSAVEVNCVLLQGNFFLNQNMSLLLQKVALVDVTMLQLQIVLFQICDVFDDFLQNIVGSFSCMVFESCAFAPQQLDFLPVVVQQFQRGLSISLNNLK